MPGSPVTYPTSSLTFVLHLSIAVPPQTKNAHRRLQASILEGQHLGPGDGGPAELQDVMRVFVSLAGKAGADGVPQVLCLHGRPPALGPGDPAGRWSCCVVSSVCWSERSAHASRSLPIPCLIHVDSCALQAVTAEMQSCSSLSYRRSCRCCQTSWQRQTSRLRWQRKVMLLQGAGRSRGHVQLGPRSMEASQWFA